MKKLIITGYEPTGKFSVKEIDLSAFASNFAGNVAVFAEARRPRYVTQIDGSVVKKFVYHELKISTHRTIEAANNAAAKLTKAFSLCLPQR